MSDALQSLGDYLEKAKRMASELFPQDEPLDQTQTEKSMNGIQELGEYVEKAGPYIGPKGGKWADPKHTIPWDEKKHGKKKKGILRRVGEKLAQVGEAAERVEREQKPIWEYLKPKRATEKSMDAVDQLGAYFQKAQRDDQPGESLGETSTEELQETHADLVHRIKTKPDDPSLQARHQAISAELKRRGKNVMQKGDKKPTTTTIQTLIFDKDKYDAAKAKAWADSHDFTSGKVDITGDSIRLRQKDPGAFQEGSFRTITFKPGIKAVIGRPKTVEKSVSGIEELSEYLAKAVPEAERHKPAKPPKEYREAGATERSDYAVPAEYKYPIDTEAHTRAAISYFSKPKNAGVYSVSEQKAIWGRIKSAAKKFKIELSPESGPPSVQKKTEKSMSGIEELSKYLAKADTSTSSPQPNVGESGAISGDNAAGAGPLPHGDTNFTGRGPEDGDDLEGKGKQHSKTGPADMPHPASAKPGDQLSDDDVAVEQQMKPAQPNEFRGGQQTMLGRWKKSLETQYTQQELRHEHRHAEAVLASQLRKGEPDLVVTGGQPRDPGQPQVEKAETFMHGDRVIYSNASDIACEQIQKSEDGFYHGAPPRVDATGTLRKSTECANGHQMSAVLASCPTCGVNATGQPISSAGYAYGLQLVKSGRGLEPAYEPDLVLPDGLVVEDEDTE